MGQGLKQLPLAAAAIRIVEFYEASSPLLSHDGHDETHPRCFSKAPELRQSPHQNPVGQGHKPLRCVDRAIRQAGVPDHEQCVLQRVDGFEPLNLPELAGFPNHLPGVATPLSDCPEHMRRHRCSSWDGRTDGI